MTCRHTKDVSRYVDVYCDYTGETTREWDQREEWTIVDLDIGRFKCTQCNEVMYYTGQWKKFYEEGIPCIGSDNIRRY